MITRFKCENCGNDGGDAPLVLIDEVVGKILLGMDRTNTLVGEGEPLHFEKQSTHAHHVWCDACGTTGYPISIEDEDEDNV